MKTIIVPNSYICLYNLYAHMYTPSSVQKVSSHTLKNRHLLKKIQDIRNIVHRTMTPQSPSKKAPWGLTQFSQCLSHCSQHFAKSFVGITISSPVTFSWISSTVWNLFPFKTKGDFSFGKSQQSQGVKSGLPGGLSHLGNLMFAKKLYTRHEVWEWWWSCQSPVAHSCACFWSVVSLNWWRSVANLCWLQPVHVQHSQVFCLLEAF